MRRKGWKHYSGYTRAKRQMKRDLGIYEANRTANALMPVVVVAGVIVIAVVYFAVKSPVAVGTIAVAAAIIGGIWWYTSTKQKERRAEEERLRLEEERKQRRAELLAKYRDEEVVDYIMEGRLHLGMTAEMLRDTLGPPEAVDVKALKTKKREVWKYAHQGGNRYGIRLTLDDDALANMDVKDEYIQEVTERQI